MNTLKRETYERRIRFIAGASSVLAAGWVVLFATRFPAAARAGARGIIAMIVYFVLALMVCTSLVRRMSGRTAAPRDQKSVTQLWWICILANAIWAIFLPWNGSGGVRATVGLVGIAVAIVLAVLGIRFERSLRTLVVSR